MLAAWGTTRSIDAKQQLLNALRNALPQKPELAETALKMALAATKDRNANVSRVGHELVGDVIKTQADKATPELVQFVAEAAFWNPEYAIRSGLQPVLQALIKGGVQTEAVLHAAVAAVQIKPPRPRRKDSHSRPGDSEMRMTGLWVIAALCTEQPQLASQKLATLVTKIALRYGFPPLHDKTGSALHALAKNDALAQVILDLANAALRNKDPDVRARVPTIAHIVAAASPPSHEKVMTILDRAASDAAPAVQKNTLRTLDAFAQDNAEDPVMLGRILKIVVRTLDDGLVTAEQPQKDVSQGLNIVRLIEKDHPLIKEKLVSAEPPRLFWSMRALEKLAKQQPS